LALFCEFYSILTPDFIQAVHTNPLALEFWSFLNETIVPDEQCYPSLIHLPELPGGKARVVSNYTYDELLSHKKVWDDHISDICQSSQFYNSIYPFNYKDLVKIKDSDRLFANKYNQDLDLFGMVFWKRRLRIKKIISKILILETTLINIYLLEK
jgi:hypothetical protein